MKNVMNIICQPVSAVSVFTRPTRSIIVQANPDTGGFWLVPRLDELNVDVLRLICDFLAGRNDLDIALVSKRLHACSATADRMGGRRALCAASSG
ncbi:hypothetical protein C8Q80DRAFT_1160936 [Daedaleopsis nitida]|nr:hypothetical protein C8Q80DRAFT_1160936 [Daedaleopsis nitida]